MCGFLQLQIWFVAYAQFYQDHLQICKKAYFFNWFELMVAIIFIPTSLFVARLTMFYSISF